MAEQHNKFGQVASNAIDADLYYPLFCTPYYGYQPTSHTDFLVMVYQLSAFIVHCCYTKEGALNPCYCLQRGHQLHTGRPYVSPLNDL